MPEKTCVDGKRHNYKPLSDDYVKYEAVESSNNSSGSNRYQDKKNVFPGLTFCTLFCSGCGNVIEVIAMNQNKEIKHYASEEITQDNTTQTTSQVTN